MPDRVAKVEEWESTVDDSVLKLPDRVARVPELVLTVDDSELKLLDSEAIVVVSMLCENFNCPIVAPSVFALPSAMFCSRRLSVPLPIEKVAVGKA